jgi:putative ABC transport system permease protein
VGVGVVSLFAVFGASLSRSIEESVDRTFAGDLVLTPAGSDFGGSGLPSSTATEVAALPEVDRAAGSGYGAVTLDGDDHDMDFGDLGELATLADFDVVEGDLAAVGDRGLAVSVDVAAEHGWTVGDAVDVGFVDGATEPFTVSALYGNDTMDGTVFMELDAWQAHNPQTAFTQVFVGLADGVSVDEGRTAVEEATRGPGAPIVRDRDQFIESEAGEVQGLLNVVYGLLAIAILIALMGIANTLSLSTHERTRELGLLRAVGQSRSQLRAMVRWESVVVATFGAVEGLGLGLFLGWGLVRALNASEGFGTFSLPVGTLVTVLVLGALIGVIAGLRPAWRASRLDVLAAVSAN